MWPRDIVATVTTLLLPSTMSDDPTLPADVRVVRYDVNAPVPDDALDAEVLVLWGNDPEQTGDSARRLTALRWVQTLAAGPDAALAAGFADDVVLTSGRGLHDGPVAEHTLALVLAAARRLPDLVRAQSEHRWADELGGMQEARPGQAFRTLDGAEVLIWGFGSIAARLAPLLQRTGRPRHGRRDRRRRPARLPGDLRVRPARPPAAHRRADLVAARHRADPARGRRRRPGSAAPARVGGQRGPRRDARRVRAARRAPVQAGWRARPSTCSRPSPSPADSHCGTSREC